MAAKVAELEAEVEELKISNHELSKHSQELQHISQDITSSLSNIETKCQQKIVSMQVLLTHQNEEIKELKIKLAEEERLVRECESAVEGQNEEIGQLVQELKRREFFLQRTAQ